MTLSGRVAVVTGASMGIGEAIAKVFVDHGASVVLLSRDAGRAEAARANLGNQDRTLALACDVRRQEDIEQAVSATAQRFGRLDIWVNNAGYGLLDSVARADIGACQAMFETNLFGAMTAMQAVIPVMQRQGSGTIINISSVGGHVPLPYHAVYSATKFAMNAIGKGARIELKSCGVHVMTVCPGYVSTNFAANVVRGKDARILQSPNTRGITAGRVARAVLRGYLKQKREVVVPWTMHPVIKLYQLFPSLVEWGMMKMVRAAK